MNCTDAKWASVLTPGGAEFLFPSVAHSALTHRTCSSCMLCEQLIQIKCTAAVWPVMSAPRTEVALIPLPVQEARQHTVYVTHPSRIWRQCYLQMSLRDHLLRGSLGSIPHSQTCISGAGQ